MNQQLNGAFPFQHPYRIEGDIFWGDSPDGPHKREFSKPIIPNSGAESLRVFGAYLRATARAAAKLSFTIISSERGRIYALDMGKPHRNPDRMVVGRTHKHYWTETDKSDWAYEPDDITAPSNRPTEVWRQFCQEARISHNGIMHPP